MWKHKHNHNGRTDQYDYDSRNYEHNHNGRNHKHYDNCRNDEYDNHSGNNFDDDHFRNNQHDNDRFWRMHWRCDLGLPVLGRCSAVGACCFVWSGMHV